MKTYEGMVVRLHAFVILTLGVGERSDSRVAGFICGNGPASTQWLGGWFVPKEESLLLLLIPQSSCRTELFRMTVGALYVWYRQAYVTGRPQLEVTQLLLQQNAHFYY
jgi:hypothetical protein